MERHVESVIEINAPVDVVYGEWSKFEQFPQFMRGVIEVTETDATHLHWLADIGGVTEEWDTEITENVPNQRIAWRSTSGSKNTGLIVFDPISNGTTRVSLTVDYRPEGIVESIGDILGIVRRRIEGDLERFKEHVEHED
ncbi:MAG: SRPBCC family protein [Gammaproteobacteria bacterium]